MFELLHRKRSQRHALHVPEREVAVLALVGGYQHQMLTLTPSLAFVGPPWLLPLPYTDASPAANAPRRAGTRRGGGPTYRAAGLMSLPSNCSMA